MGGSGAALALALWALGAGALGGSAGSVGGGGGGGCAVYEWACRGGGCVRADQFCDASAQCADGSDEPPHCSPCNRTYYGLAGAAHALALSLPGSPRLPFLCQLTFTAGGGALGDLVQLTFDEFRVGRFVAQAEGGEACPEGFLTLAELGRPFTGGAWCGEAAGAAAYFSETSTVTASVKLAAGGRGGLALRLRYRFLPLRAAVVRLGAPGAPLERGLVAPGTYCTRSLDECHRRACRLQSPNFPGLVPRGVSCYWLVRQRAVPTCKHAMLAVSQPLAHRLQLKRSVQAPASMNRTGRGVRAWAACSGGQRDRLLVYDGGSTDDALLLEWCGGAWPKVTARGPQLLVAFHASPRPAPPPPAPRNALQGFELHVDVVFADSDSLDYAREARRCEFHVKASAPEDELNATLTWGGEGVPGGAESPLPLPGRGRRGVLRAPAHTLPPDSTCTWTFHGRPGDLVWVYFSSFTSYSLVEARRADGSGERADDEGGAQHDGQGGQGGQGECAVEVRLWEGDEPAALAPRWCDAAPVLCARAALANATRAVRPCAPPDARVSRGPLLALSVRSRPGTAVHPLAFALHYEFVDARLEGAAWADADARAQPARCARLLSAPGALASPRNALWFGRGGARRLRCVYRLQPQGGRGVALRLAAAAFGRRGSGALCATRPHALTGRPSCVPLAPEDGGDGDGGDETEEESHSALALGPHLMVWESPWAGVRVPLACVCDAAGAAGLALGGAALELELVGGRLDPREDHRHLFFRGEWEARPPHRCAALRHLQPPGTHLHLEYPYRGDAQSECGATPYLLAPSGNRSLLVRVWGTELAMPPPGAEPPPCATANRVLVYDAHTSRLVKAVCPSEGEGEGESEVRLVWPEWGSGGGGAGGGTGRLAVVWLAREAGSARVAWMEVWRGPTVTWPEGPMANATSSCERSCPSLGACMPSALWCDGRADCPGGADERGGCGARGRLVRLVAAHGAAWGGAVGSLCALALVLWALGALRRSSAKQPGDAAGDCAEPGPLLGRSRASSAASAS